MHAARVGRRGATALAGLLIAGAASLLATPATAAPVPPADQQPGMAMSAAPAPHGNATPTTARPMTAAAEARGKVVSRLTLTIREKATTNSRSLSGVQPGAIIYLHCKVTGQNVDGNTLWYKLGNGRPGYVTVRYVQNLSSVPWC